MRTHRFKDRLPFFSNPTARRLLELMEQKKSNLAVAADVTTSSQLIALIEAIGPEICLLKTHIDILEDFTPALIPQLLKLSQQHHFLIFEDRKFADIGNTVSYQYGQGIYKIAQWADITNAHVLPGPGIITGLKQVGLKLGRGLLLLAEMSSEGALTDRTYAENALKMAQQHRDFTIGFIAQHKLTDDPGFLYLTPGVHIHSQQDSLGQQYNTPESVMRAGTDIIIVGRAVYNSPHPQQAATHYREAGWNAYVASLS